MGLEMVSKIQMEHDQEISADDTNPAWQIWRECKVGPEATGVQTGKHLKSMGPQTIHYLLNGRSSMPNQRKKEGTTSGSLWALLVMFPNFNKGK